MKKRAAGFVGILAVSGLVAAAPAQATTVTVGSPGPASAISANLGGVATVVDTAIPGAIVTAPANGVVTSWKIANASGGPFTLQVVHPTGSGAFTSTGSSAPGSITGSGTLTFPANLAIAKGDYVGVVNTNDGDSIGATATPGSAFIFFQPPLGSAPQNAAGGDAGEIGFNAQVLLNCVVPKLKGKKVGAAKAALAAAGCAPPTVKKGKRKGKFVRKQSSAPGSEIRGDAAVTLKLGPKPKKK
jgi:PASTA domain